MRADREIYATLISRWMCCVVPHASQNPLEELSDSIGDDDVVTQTVRHHVPLVKEIMLRYPEETKLIPT